MPQSHRRCRLALIGALLLAACAPRAPLVLMGDTSGAVETVSVYTRTIRGRGEDGTPGAIRSEQTLRTRIDVSIPPDREPGTIVHATARKDARREFLVTGADILPGDAAFQRAITGALARRAPKDRQVILYVHGFNNTFSDGVLRIAQLTHDTGLKSVAAHYSWPSAANPLNYAYDRDSVMFARDGLEETIRLIAATDPAELLIVAHSMGSLLTMETFRQMSIAEPGSVSRLVDGVIFLSPDIDVDVFRSQARRIGTLPDPFVIFVSKRDRALLLSARLTGQTARVGNIENLERLAELPITILDVTDFSSGLGHFTAGSSPALLRILAQRENIDAAFTRDSAARTGALPGTVLTLQNLTEIVLSPVTALGQ